MNPTEVVIDAVIGGVKRKLYFNWNAYAKFEEFSSIQENGRRLNFTKFVFQLYALIQKAAAKTQAIGENATSEDSQRVLLEAIGELGVTDIRALICGACHVYDREDNPSWPLSPGQLGRIMTVAEMSEAIPKIVSAVMPCLTPVADGPEMERICATVEKISGDAPSPILKSVPFAERIAIAFLLGEE